LRLVGDLFESYDDARTNLKINKVTSLEFHRPKKFQSLAMLKLEVTHLF
jgi:hypothetical protein